MSLATTHPLEAVVLRSLLGTIMASDPDLAPETALDPRLHFGARASYFLLDVLPGSDPETFLQFTLHRLLRQLNHNTEQRRVKLRGRIRGRADWPATLKSRYGDDYDPSRYICREVRHQYNTPENQLLKYLLARMAECLEAIPEVIRAGLCYLPLTGDRHVIRTADRLRSMETALYNLRFNTRLGDVEMPEQIEEGHLLKAETVRFEEYAAVARLYRRYRDSVATASWEALFEIGRRVLPLPSSTGKDGDPWISFAAVLLRTHRRRRGDARPTQVAFQRP